jgi:hypothetical protein
MTGKDFSGPVPEIRVPTPQLQPMDGMSRSPGNSALNTVTVSENGEKTIANDGIVIIGEADGFPPG